MIETMGFFRELSHGSPDGPSLRDSIGNALFDEDLICRYLAECQILGVTGSVVYDIIDQSRPVSGRNAIRTDGLWVWPDDLSYYVRRYHVRLPPEFINHGRQLEWRIQQLSEASLLEIEEELLGDH